MKELLLELIHGSKEAWFYGLDALRQDNSGLQPHLFLPEKTNREAAFFKNLYSMNSFSPFGWMGGSVQDALLELHLMGKSAAFAWGFRMGIPGEEFAKAALLAYQALHEYISEDGFLRSVSQINRGGEVLQKGGYRVISQFGMGLVAQLYAGLNEVK